HSEQPGRLVIPQLATMQDRIVEARISVVLSHPALELRRVLDGEQAGSRMPCPKEVSAADGLVCTIHANRVVSRSASEIIPPAFLGVISERARIDEQLVPARAQSEGQRSGRTV